MKHCDICGVDVDTEKEICPLCYNRLEEKSPKVTAEFFQTKKAEKKKSAKKIVAKIFLIISLFVVCTCVYINVKTQTVAWSLVVGLSVLYVWVLVAHTIMSRDTPFKKVLYQIVSIVALLLATNKVFSSNEWLTNYTFPSLAILVTIILTFYIFCSKKRKTVLYSFFSIIILLLIVSVLLLGLKVDDFKFLNQINIIFQSIVAVSYLIFGWRDIKNEAIRKFHL